MLRGSWILRLFPYERAVRIQDQSSRFYFPTPSLRLTVWLSFHKDSALGPRPSARAPPGFWMLDPGICGRFGPVWAARILYSGFWKLGCQMDGGVWAAQILYSVFWKVGCRREGRRPPGFWILYSGNWGVEGGRAGAHSVFCILYSAFCILPATCACDAYAWEQRWHMSGCWILDSGNWAVGGVWRPPGFCILYSVFCRPHMHVMHIHVSGGRNDGGVWAARILYSVFCILPAAYARPHVHVMHIHVSGGRRCVGRPDSVFCILYSAGRICT